ncbi:MAG: hypothetical protein JNL82_18815 [Myxococcales bacterium]|nr:hypothetical protein [Myxococcales bacterium]
MAPERRRLALILRTMAYALLAQVVAAVYVLGWVGSSVVTAGLLAMFVRHAWRERDALLAKILLFGLVVGFGELPADHFGVVVTDTLVYTPGGPQVWVTPLYMPFGWVVMMVQLGVLAHWLARRWGPLRTCFALAVLGGLNIPAHELLAKYADLWHYQNTPMVLGAVPHYVILAEAMLGMVIPLLLLRAAETSWRGVIVLGALQAAAIYVAGRVAFALVG